MDHEAASRIRKLDEVLRSVPYQYQHKDRMRNDVAALLRSCHTLQPQTGSFSGGGREVTLFYLYGVLPISYMGNTYNIPVTIYFDPPYPHLAPRCFVTPTGTMAVSQGHPNVDQGGMVYFPYLSSWNERTSSLVEMITGMRSIFSTNPPVYSTQQSGASRPQPAAQASAATPGLFGALGGLLGMAQPQPQPQPQPAQPVPVATPVQPVQPVQPVRPVVAAHVAQPAVQARPAHQQPNRKEELVRKATEALKERWSFVAEPLVIEANEQLERRAELKAEAKRVEEQLAKLSTEEGRQSRQVKHLETLEAELNTFVTANEGKEPNPDELRESLDPDSAQVLDLLAEELSLEELLGALDELLSEKKISIDDFLREVRDVSRRRFMCQVQRKKCEAAVKGASTSAARDAVPAAPAAAAARPVADAGSGRTLVAA